MRLAELPRAARRTLWVAASLLLLGVFSLVALDIAGNTPSGRLLIERLTARLTSGHVIALGLAGSFPDALELKSLELRDAEGTWLTAEDISLRWSPLELLTRHLEVDDLRVVRLAMERRPIPSSPSSNAFTLRHSDLEQVTVGTLELGAPLTGVRAELSAAGQVHLRSLNAARIDVSGRRLDGEGSYQLTVALTPARIDARVMLKEPAGGPLQNLIGLPMLGALSLDATAQGPRNAERLGLSLSAGALRGEVSGMLDLSASRTDLRYVLDAPAMSPRPGLTWRQLHLDGRWAGAFAAPSAEGKLRIEGLQLADQLRLDSLHAELGANGGTVTLQSVVEGLELPGADPTLLAAAPLALDANLHLNQPDRPLEVTASHALFALHAKAVTGGNPSATFDLRLPRLASLATFTGVSLEGSAAITGRISRDSSGTHAATRFALDGKADLSGRSAWWAASLGASPRFDLSGVADDRGVELERLRLTGRALSLALSGSETPAAGTAPGAAPPVVHGRFDLVLGDLAVLSPALDGRLDLSGKVAGPTSALTTDADLEANLAVRGSPRGKLVAAVRVVGLPRAPRGTLRAHGMLAGAPLDLDASLEGGAEQSARLLVHRADWRSAHMEGDVAGGTDPSLAHGRLRFGIEHLQDLEPLLGRVVEGTVSGSLALTPVRGVSQATLDIQARDLKMGSFAGALQLTGSGPADALELKFDAQIPEWRGAPLTLTSRALLEPSRHQLELQTAGATFRDLDLKLLAPARVDYQSGVTVNSLRFGADGAVLEAGGRILPTLDAHATLRGVTPRLISAFAPGVLSDGTLSAEAVLSGSLGSPQGTLRLDARGLRLASDLVVGAPLVNIDAEAHLLESAAQLDARFEAGQGSLLTLKGQTPLGTDGSFDLKLLGKLDLALVNPLLEAHGRHAAGVLNVDASITGNAAAPDIGGSVRLVQGDLRDYSQGVHFTNVSALVEGSQGTLHLQSLTARAAPGTVTMTGTLGLFEPKLPIDLSLSAHNARPIASNLVTADLDADLHLKGTLRERLDLTGTIHSTRTRIEIPDSLPPDVAVLDVRRPGAALRTPTESKLVVGLDVTLNAPNQVLVQGRGLSAELGGEAHIAGTADSPLVTGGFDLIRGTFSLASTQLNFTTGQVSFNGAGLRNRIDPTLDFTAQTTVLDVTAILKITGLADSPVFTLTSTPELPQDEILARLLFGESASQLSTLQVAEIGVALTSLSGSGTGLNPLVRIQKSLGLDRLAVGGGTSTTGNTTNTGATLEAGRYVSKRVYVGAKQSTTGATQLQVQVDLTKHLKLQSQLGNGTAPVQGTTPENDPGSSVGISYQFEY